MTAKDILETEIPNRLKAKADRSEDLEQMLEKIGPTLVCSAITEDKKFQRALADATHIDRLNLGPLPTIQLNWLQPHEGNIVDFLFRARAFQFDKEMVKI